MTDAIFLNRRQEWGTESDAYIQQVLDQHTPCLQSGGEAFKGRCMYCDYTREPCDTASVAATALVRIDSLAAVRLENQRLTEQVRIATDRLQAFSDQGTERYPGEMGTFAEDALIQMSVVE